MALPAPEDVHVWAIDLARDASEVGALGGLLSAEELRRAAGVRTEDGRRRFVVTRAALRALLGRYLGFEPQALAFAEGPHGKPRLEPRSPLRFNVSHSGELALVACAREREVGIDVEWTVRERDVPGLVRAYLAVNERAAVAEAPATDVAFYRHWVAKEAFAKADGRGVARSLRAVEVALDEPSGPRIVHVGGDELEAARWSLDLLDGLPDGYVAALVVEAGAHARPVASFDPLRAQ